MNKRPNNTIRAKCTGDSFFRTWMEFLAPFHRLTSRQREAAARILKQYFRLKASIDDPEVLRDVLWSRTSRKDMMESLNMSPAHFQMVMAALKKAEFLIDDDLNPKYIPHITGDPYHIMCIVFDWSSDSNKLRRPTDGEEQG